MSRCPLFVTIAAGMILASGCTDSGADYNPATASTASIVEPPTSSTIATPAASSTIESASTSPSSGPTDALESDPSANAEYLSSVLVIMRQADALSVDRALLAQMAAGDPEGYWDGRYGFVAERYRDGWLTLQTELAAIEPPLEFQADYDTTTAFVEHALASANCLVVAAAGTLPPEESNELVSTCVRPENDMAQALIDSMESD